MTSSGPAIGGFVVDPATLEAHAGALEASGRRIASGAPGPAALSRGAFGLIGGVFAGAATEAAALGVAALEAACAGLAAAADEVRGAAADYVEADLRAALGLEQAARGGSR